MVHRLLTAVASLVAGHGLEGAWALVVVACSSVAVADGLSCSMACGILVS